ncbi:MAG: Ig-like domain-containing protein, partial [Acinetobacter sp.]
MNNVDIFEKGSTQQLTIEKAPQHQSVYEVHVNKDQVSKLTRIDNNLEITLLNGAKIIIPSFFAANFVQELVFESDGQYALVKMDNFNSEGVATTVDYLAIDNFDEFLKEQPLSNGDAIPMLAWIAGGALVAGAIAATSSNSSNNDNGESKPIDTSAPEIHANVKDATHVEVTSNEAGTIIITDAQGQVIGSGTAINGKTEITLTRPLQDNEEIKVSVTDQAGNTSQENVLVGDVTAPTIEIEIKDENNITVKSDEAGAEVVIKNENGEIIGSGITGSDGTVDIILTKPVIDGETITVGVVDDAGNRAEESIIVPDLTAPLINADVKDATHVEVTSNEAGTIIITDAQGQVIGSGTAINGKTEITLTRPLENNEIIKIIVSDLAGNQAQEDIEVTGIMPPSEDTTAPILTGSAVNTAGELVLSFNENLDAQHPPQNKDFTILIDGVLRTPDSITITGQTLTLNFTPPI